VLAAKSLAQHEISISVKIPQQALSFLEYH